MAVPYYNRIRSVQQYEEELEEDNLIVLVFAERHSFSTNLLNGLLHLDANEYGGVNFLFVNVDDPICEPIVNEFQIECFPTTFFLHEKAFCADPVFGDNIYAIINKINEYKIAMNI